jgi:hypothetical protein
VDEGIHVTKLKFDRSPDIVEPSNSTVLANDLEAPLKAALVIVRHFKDEQILENVSVHGLGNI